MLPVEPINLPTFAQSNPLIEGLKNMQQMHAQSLADQNMAMANQYQPQTLQQQLQNLRDKDAYTKQMSSYYPELIAAKIQSAKQAGMPLQQKLINAYNQSQPGTQEHAYYAALLNNSAAGKKGTSVTMADGSSVNVGGSASPANIFSSGLSNNAPQSASPNGSTTASNAQKGGRGNSGTVYTKRDKYGNIVNQTSAQTNKNLSANQAGAQAIQTILPQLNDVDKLSPDAQFNYYGGGISHFVHGLANMADPRQDSDVEKYNDAESRLAGIQDTLTNAINVPKTTPGLDVLHKFIYPGSYEDQSQYAYRLKHTIVPELNQRYQILTNALRDGIKLTPVQKVQILNGESTSGLSNSLKRMSGGSKSDPLGIR